MDTPSFEHIYDLALQLSAEDRLRLIEELSASSPQLSAKMILDTLDEHSLALQNLGVERIGLFGSYARGDARLDSDIDLLVHMSDPHYSYWALLDVQAYFEKLFTPKDALKPGIRQNILNEVVYAKRT